MRLCALFGLILLALALAGCQRNSDTVSATPVSETFPEPKASEERSTFAKVLAKRTGIEDKRKELEASQESIVAAFIAEHPGADSSPPPDGGPENITPEVREARQGLRKLRGELIKSTAELNEESNQFMSAEYFPALLIYAAYCHKTFLAEPNKSNGGELVKLVDQLYDNGNLDEAFLYSNDLVKNGFESSELHDLVAASAFCTEHFDEAAAYFDKARQTGRYVRASLVTNMEEIVQSQKAWEKEQQIRAKEAAADDLPRVKLETEAGDLVFELFENEAPETVANYISLVESGYYDNTTFYSVVLTSHMFHGCKTSDNRSTPGYRIYCETGKPDQRFPFRGALTMFIASKDLGGSIYTISIRPAPFNFGYVTTFGRIVEGLDVLPKIAKFNLRFPTPGMVPTKVIKATVLRKRDHEYKPHKVE